VTSVPFSVMHPDVTFEGTRNVLEARVAGGVDGVKPLHAGDRKGDIKQSYADIQGSEGCSGV